MILGKCKALKSFMMPPSLFSLSSKPPYSDIRLLRDIHVEYLGVYVYDYEKVETRYFIKQLLPSTLKELCIHDEGHLVLRELKNDEYKKLPFKVHFFPLFTCIVKDIQSIFLRSVFRCCLSYHV